MKVVIAAGGRFHAFHLAHQLEKRKVLQKVYTGSYTKNDRSYISLDLVDQNNYFKFLSFLFTKFRFYKFFNKSKLHVLTDSLFDYVISKKIEKEKPFDIFVGWANYFYESIEKIRKSGAKIVLESGSTHILEQQKLLKEEYARFNIPFSPICKKNIDKVLAEYSAADYIMTCSKFTYDSFLKHGISKNKMLKVPYGVNLSFFQSVKKISHKKFRVICVGLMCLRKGIPYLINAWKKLNLPENETELLLVGNIHKDLRYFLKKIKLPQNIIFFGSTDRRTLSRLYAKSDLFVLPSIEEGLSMTIAEAMSCGLPVVCTTNTGGQELVESNKHGFVVPIRNENILAERILWFFNNPLQRIALGINAKNKAKDFSWDVYGDKVYKAYKKISLKNF